MLTKRLPTAFISALFIVLLVISANASAEAWKIAVAATGEGETALIAEQAARAPYFLFFNNNGQFIEAVKNPAQNLSGGAGNRAAFFVSSKGATLIIAGNIGNKMEQALRDLKIEFKEYSGVAHDVVQTIVNNP